MKHAQKMAIIPEHLLQSMETERRLTAPVQLPTLTRLDQDMKQIIESPLAEDQKEEQYALPTLMSTTAIIGTRNLEDYPEVVAELQELFKRSLHIPHTECVEMNKLCSALSLLSIS